MSNNVPLRPGRTSVDSRGPTLIPNFDQVVASGAGTFDQVAPATYLASNPRANATATATLGGTVTSGDVLTLTLSNPIFPNGLISHSITAGGSDTLNSLAEAFAKAFNDDTTAQQYGIDVDGVAAVLTFNWPGQVGNSAVLSAPTEAPTTITVGGTALTGDTFFVEFSGAGIGPTPIVVSFASTTGNTTTQGATGIKNAINANAALTALGISATSSSAVVTLAGTSSDEPVTVTGWVNTTSPTMVIGGTVAAGDVNTLTITGAALTGSPISVNYTALLGDTTTSVAAGLAAAINSNVVLAKAGITASNTTNTVNIVDPGNVGQLRFTFSTTGSETGTPPTTPTETVTIATTATETITLSPTSGILSGGSGPVIAYGNFSYGFNGVLEDYWAGNVYPLPPPLVAQMVRDQMQIV